MINRIKNLIEKHGENEDDITAISFTKNTSESLKSKLKDMGYPNVNVSTFHGLCAKLLAKEGKFFSQDKLIQDWQVEKAFNLGVDSKIDVGDITSFISYQKNYLKTYTDTFVSKESEYSEIELRNYFRIYENFKTANGLHDFDDYAIDCLQMLKENPKKYSLKHILVDENQDSNSANNLLVRELCLSGNIFVVGDYRQCFPVGSKIKTHNGEKNIEDVLLNDRIIVANGRGTTIETGVSEVIRKKYSGKLIELKTESGKIIKATPNHTFFLNTLIENKHYIYLMYREGFGFRIGRSCHNHFSKKSEVQSRNGYETRMVHEKASKVWLIKVCNDLESAMFYENYYAFEYGIPMYVFNYKDRDGIMKQDMIFKLFNSIDTEERGLRLLHDVYLSFDYPHYVPQPSGNSESIKKRRINFVLFGSARRVVGKNTTYIGNNHELSFSSIDQEFSDEAKKYFVKGVEKRANGQGFEYYMGRKSNSDQDQLLDIANNILENVENTELHCKAVLTSDSLIKFKFMPLMNARVGMGIPIYIDGNVVEDKIVEISIHNYDGYVYDLNVDLYRNYIVDSVVVHNCIYGFRGSDPEHFMNFDKDWENATVINLDTNYRSCKLIVKKANEFIKKYYGDYEHYSDAIAHREEIGTVNIISHLDRESEGKKVVDSIESLLSEFEDPKEIAVLYRLNSHSIHIEHELIKRKIDYDITSDGSFFKRKEIAGILAYLKLIINPHDDGAFLDIFKMRNYPLAFFSGKVLEDIKRYSGTHNLSLFEALIDIRHEKEWLQKNATAFGDYITKLRLQKDKNISTVDLISNIIKVFQVYEYIDKKYANPEDKKDRLESLNTLKSFAKADTPEKFIKYITNTKKKKKDSCIRLMSCHASKGLEMKHVYLIGIEDGKFPHERSSLIDEARLFYVGVTRPKDNLTLSEIGLGNRFVTEYR